MITIDPRDPRPIWRQIEEAFRDLVLLGRLAPGASIPSVRELARATEVNPATVSKAYRQLTDAGYFEVKRGEGTFVADTAPRLGRRERRQRLHDEAGRLVQLADALGASAKDVDQVLTQAWEELHDEKRRIASG